jgi:sulfate transport system substrate-binding protein
MSFRRLAAALMTLLLAACRSSAPSDGAVLLHVSYDPTRELYQEINAAFAQEWIERTGAPVTIHMSHAGSGKQARAVIDGLQADVVSLALPFDADAIASRGGKLVPEWSTRFPHGSAPFTTTVVFLVRKGNPHGVRDWGDLASPAISVVTPHPKTSGGARYNYLAAWGCMMRSYGGDQARTRQFVAALLRNVPVLDSGARGATATFVQRGIGDVLLAWESEALLAAHQLAPGQVEIVVPSCSILAAPPVAVVDQAVDAHSTRAVAEAYLSFLFTPRGQRIAARHHFRPTDPQVALSHHETFPRLSLLSVEDIAGDWSAAHREHFDERGSFDQLFPVP